MPLMNRPYLLMNSAAASWKGVASDSNVIQHGKAVAGTQDPPMEHLDLQNGAALASNLTLFVHWHAPQQLRTTAHARTSSRNTAASPMH